MEKQVKLQELGQEFLKLQRKSEKLGIEIDAMDKRAATFLGTDNIEQICLDAVYYQLNLDAEGALVMVVVQPPEREEEPITPGQLAYLEGLRYPDACKLTKRQAQIALSQLAKPRDPELEKLPVSPSQEKILRAENFWDNGLPQPKNFAEAYQRVSRLLTRNKPVSAAQLETLAAFSFKAVKTACAAHDILGWSKAQADKAQN